MNEKNNIKTITEKILWLFKNKKIIGRNDMLYIFKNGIIKILIIILVIMIIFSSFNNTNEINIPVINILLWTLPIYIFTKLFILLVIRKKDILSNIKYCIYEYVFILIFILVNKKNLEINIFDLINYNYGLKEIIDGIYNIFNTFICTYIIYLIVNIIFSILNAFLFPLDENDLTTENKNENTIILNNFGKCIKVKSELKEKYKERFLNKDALYKSIAYHEAGHCCLFLIQGLIDVSIKINFDEFNLTNGSLAYCNRKEEIINVENNASLEGLLIFLKVYLAGILSNEIVYNLYPNNILHLIGTKSDLEKANQIADIIVIENGYYTDNELLLIDFLSENEKNKYKLKFLKQQQEETRKILQENWELVESLANNLLESKEGMLDEKEVLNIYNQYKNKKCY